MVNDLVSSTQSKMDDLESEAKNWKRKYEDRDEEIESLRTSLDEQQRKTARLETTVTLFIDSIQGTTASRG